MDSGGPSWGHAPYEDGARQAALPCDLCARPLAVEGHKITFQTAAGVAIAEADDISAEEMLRHADLALCRARVWAALCRARAQPRPRPARVSVIALAI